MRIIALLAVLLQAAVQPPPTDVTRLAVSAPARVLAVSADALRGTPTRLAWSPDASAIYVRAVKADIWGNQTIFHYQILLAAPKLEPIPSEPEWAGRYWMWKSAQASPADPEFRITYETREERRTATGVSNAGSLAQNGGDPSFGAELGPQGAAIATMAIQGQVVRTTTLALKGQILGEFVNMTPILGLAFGWAPARMTLVAYVDTKGRLVLMDKSGRRHALAGVEKAFLPAWTEDGRRLAWLERANRKITLLVAGVSGG